MGIPGIGTAFFSILKYFLLLCALFFLSVFIDVVIFNNPPIIRIKEAIIPSMMYTICMVVGYATGIINGIIIGRTE